MYSNLLATNERMRLIILGCLALGLMFAEQIWASEVTVTWLPPEVRENGDTLTAAELGPYVLYLYVGADVVHQVEIQPDATEVLVDQLEQYTTGPIGMTITASDKTGLTSKHSNRIDFSISAATAPVIILRWGE